MIYANVMFTFCYSDITIGLNGRELKGHKFVLAARSDIWGVSELVHASNIDLGGKQK